VHHMHHGSEAATTAGATSQQRHRTPCKMERLNGIWGHKVTTVMISRPPGFRLFKLSSHTTAPAPHLPTVHPWAEVRHFSAMSRTGIRGRHPVDAPP